jgi:hypothetical protein
MDASDLEIVEYTVDLMRHGLTCNRRGCTSCKKLGEIVQVIRDLIFDTHPTIRRDDADRGTATVLRD